MKKVFILESKGEILGMLTHTEKTYIEFQSEVEEVMKEGNTDFRTVKGILTSLYGYELVEIVASAEVTKRKGGF
jgi:hypothetical protein